MARSDKVTAVAEIADEFRTSSATLLTEYRGLTVGQLKELRRSLGENVNYAVVKNTLTKLAAKEAGVTGFDDLLAGPSAIAFVKGDPVEAAKGLRDFAKNYPALVIKGGLLDGNFLDAKQITKLADLESREVLLAKLAGAMKASMSQAASLFNAPLSQAARTFDALRVKAEADPSVIAGAGAAAPAAEPEAAAAEPAETATAEPAETEATEPAETAINAAEEAVVEAETEAPVDLVAEVEEATETPSEG